MYMYYQQRPEDPKQDLHQERENKWKNISEKTETDTAKFFKPGVTAGGRFDWTSTG